MSKDFRDRRRDGYADRAEDGYRKKRKTAVKKQKANWTKRYLTGELEAEEDFFDHE